MSLLLYVALGFVVLNLIYLSVQDIKESEVQAVHLAILVGSLLLINLSVMLTLGFYSYIPLWHGVYFQPLSNLVAGVIFGGVSYLLSLVSKQKYLGMADVLMLALMGLVLGFRKSVLGFNVAVFSALLFGLLQFVRVKKLKLVKIPFIPFITLGMVVSFLLYDDLLRIMEAIIVGFSR